MPIAGAALPMRCSSGWCYYALGDNTKIQPVGEFFGQEATMAHPFSQKTVRVFRSGKYVDYELGLTFEGEFSFIPTYKSDLSSGVYIFQGVRIDDEADEVVSGLFVSREHFLDHPLIFSRARPDYLAKLKQDFESAQSKFAADAQAQAIARESERQSRENFGSLLGVMGGLLAIGSMSSMGKLTDAGNLGGLIGNFGGGSGGAVAGTIAMAALGSGGHGASLGNLQSASLAALTDGILGRKSSADMLTGVVSMVAQQALQGKDSGPSGVQADVASGLAASLGQLAQNNTSMTRKQYAAQLLGAVVSGVAQTSAQATLSTPAPTPTPSAPQAIRAAPQSSYGGGAISASPNAPAGLPPSAPASLAQGTMPASNYRPAVPATAAVSPSGASPVASAAAHPASADGTTATPPGTMPVSAYIAAGAADARAQKALGETQRSIPTSTATSIVRAKPGPIQKLAQIKKVEPPYGLTVRGTHLFATNDGLYLALNDSKGGLLAGKRIAAEQGTDGWLSAEIPKGGMNFSPISLKAELHREFSIMWTSVAGRFGFINMNNSGTQGNYEDDRRVQRWVPIGSKSTSPRQWAVAGEGEIFLKSTGGGKETKFSANFDRVASPVAVMSSLAVTDEEGSTLYAAEAGLQGLTAVTVTGRIKRFDLSPFGPGVIHTLLAGHGRIWVGYGQDILTITHDQVQRFAKLNIVMPGAGPQFCLAGTTMYTADGRVIRGVDLSPSDSKDFLNLAKATSPDEGLLVAQARSALLLGVYCGRNSAIGDLLFAVGPDLQTGGLTLLEIHPGE